MNSATVESIADLFSIELIDHDKGIVVDDRIEITALTISINRLLEDEVSPKLIADALVVLIAGWRDSGVRVPWQAVNYVIEKLVPFPKSGGTFKSLNRTLRSFVDAEAYMDSSDRYFLITSYLNSGGKLTRKFLQVEKSKFLDGEPFAWLRLFVDSKRWPNDLFHFVVSYVQRRLITIGQFVSLMPDLAESLGDDDLRRLTSAIFQKCADRRDRELIREMYYTFFDEYLDSFASSPFGDFRDAVRSQVVRNAAPPYKIAPPVSESIRA